MKNNNLKEVSPFEYICAQLEKAHLKNFNGYSIAESAGQHSALVALEQQLNRLSELSKADEERRSAMKDPDEGAPSPQPENSTPSKSKK